MRRLYLSLLCLFLTTFAFGKEIAFYYDIDSNIYMDEDAEKFITAGFEASKNSFIKKDINLTNNGYRQNLYLGWGEEKNPKVKYPHINLKLREDEYKEISCIVEVYRDIEDFSNYTVNCYVERLSLKEKINFIEKVIDAAVNVFNKLPKNEVSELNLIDTFDMTSYFPSEEKLKGRIAIDVSDDNDMAILSADEAWTYNCFWKRKNCLTEDITEPYFYQPKYTDPSTLKLIDPNNPKVYVFTKDGKKNSTERITLPDGKLYSPGLADDGLPLFVDTGKNYFNSKLIKAGTQSEPLKEYTFIQGFKGRICSGNNGDYWVERFDGICVYDRDGQLKKVIFKTDKESDSSLYAVDKDNSFITYSYYSSYVEKYNYDGIKLWSAKLPAVCNNSVLSKVKNGILYFTVPGKVIRVSEKDAKLPAELEKIKTINQNLKDINNRKNNAKYYKQLADIYNLNGGVSAAYQYLKKYLELSPADSKAQEQLLNCELALAKENIKLHSEKAFALYEEFGEETAKEEYKASIKLLEKYKKYYPGDIELQKQYSELKSVFAEESGSKLTIPALKVKSVELGVLFPALMNVYACEPSGFMTVTNTSKESVKNVELTAFVRKYMDFGSASDVIAEIKAGETCVIPIKTVLNSEAMNVDENINIQMQLTLSWQEKDVQKKQVVTRPVTMYKKSAIVWKDTSMLSCFILPNDRSVTDFAFNAVQKRKNKVLSRNISNAIMICNSVGSLPVKYIPDPASPVTEIMDNEYAVDTVRLPFETLKLKGGDCDDLTTLLCSLLESTGINTALVTTAGHIFIAFDSGMSYNEVWDNLPDGFAALDVDNEAWIPVEVTAVDKGFMNAWKSACKTLMEEDFEFVTVQDSMLRYQSVSVEGTGEKYFKGSDEEKKLDEKCFDEIVKMFVETSSVSEDNCNDPVELNGIAEAYYYLNDIESAIKTLLHANKIDSKNKAVVSNLSGLYRLKGDEPNSKKYAEIAEKLPDVKVSENKGSKTSRGEDKSSVSMTASMKNAGGVRIKGKEGVVKRTMPVVNSIGGKTVTQRAVQTASSRADEKNNFEWNK